MSRYALFDRSRLELRPVAERGHDLQAAACRPLAPPERPFVHPDLAELAERIVAARRAGRPVIVMMGAHPIKLGLSRFLIDLVARGLVTHVAGNGAVLVHDFELAAYGGTSEDVARWISAGQFGLWQETSRLNGLAVAAATGGEGLGETVGRTVAAEKLPFAELSLAAACYAAGVPMTIHVGIGLDIVYSHPNCDGAAWGKASYTDFLIFARSIEELEGGVYLNLGTAVTGPEVYLKALSMARNAARGAGRTLSRFATAVFDLADLPPHWAAGPPSKEHPQYYYRPWKTILVRTVADGGRSFFFRGDHRQTIPTLWHDLVRR
jgi:hypothetical protein